MKELTQARWFMALVCCVSLLALESCTSSTAGARSDSTGDDAWPPDDPHVRLELVLAGPGRTAGRSLWRRLIGQPERRLFGRPFDIAWQGDDLLVTDPAAGRLVQVTLGGKIVASAELPGAPLGVAACGSDVVVTESRAGRVTLLDSALRLRRLLADGLERPTDVACSTAGTVWVVETGRHRALELDLSAANRGALRSLGQRGEGAGEFNFPTTVVIDGDELLIGDTLNFRLQRFSIETLEPLGAFGRLGDGAGDLPRLKGVALDRYGRIWVSDAYLDRVALFQPDGALLMSLGASGEGPGQFAFPAGIAAHPDGRVAVVDSLNRRVQIFRSLPGGAPGDLSR